MENSGLNFEQIYTMFQPKIYRYLTRLINANEAEDLTQDVFIKVNKALDTFQNKSQLSTWIYQIATNVAIDRMRSRSFKQAAVETISLTSEDLNEKNIRPNKRLRTIEEQIIRNEMNECIQEFITLLPENYRTILILSETEGLSNREIASVLGLNVGTVKIRLHRAKARLKSVLLENCSFYRTECCGRLVCERKEPVRKNTNASHSLKN